METKNNLEEQQTKKKKSKSGKKFLASNKYFTISIYVIAVIFASALIFRLVMSWTDTLNGIKKVVDILLPFIIGVVIAFILHPAVANINRLLYEKCHMKKDKMRKLISIAIAYVISIGLIILLLFGIIPQIISSITDLITAIPNAAQQIYHFVDTLQERYPNLDMEVLRTTINSAIPNAIKYIQDFATNILPTIYTFSQGIITVVVNVIIAIIVSIYILADRSMLVRGLKSVIYAFVPVKQVPTAMEIAREAHRLFSSFIVGKAVDSLIIGAICFVLMTILQLPYAVLISVIVGLTNMIPYFGPFIGAVPGALIILMFSPLKTLVFIIMIIVLQQFDGLFLGPKILGNSTGLKPLWIIFAITIGGSIGGVLGMFLGVPIIAFIQYLLKRLVNHQLNIRKTELPTAPPPFHD